MTSSRRDLLKGGLLMTAGALVPNAIAGAQEAVRRPQSRRSPSALPVSIRTSSASSSSPATASSTAPASCSISSRR